MDTSFIIYAAGALFFYGLLSKRLVVVVTVTLSVVLHGMTAPWGAHRYATWYDEQDRITDGAP